MSTCLSSKDAVKARKPYRCVFCHDPINIGDLYDMRKGVSDGFWAMRMHPECHRYEQSAAKPVDWEWYEEGSESAFDRVEALNHLATHP